MAQQLNDLERRVYNYLIDFLAENTYQPSIREIAKKFKIRSTKTVSDLLQSLTEKGYIQRDRARSRGVRLLGFAAAGGTQPVPIYERVRADDAAQPEDRAGAVTLDRRFLPGDNVFFVRMKGDALADRGVRDGDLVMVSPTMPPKEGDMVAARVGDTPIVRRMSQRDGRTFLESSSPADTPIEVKRENDVAVLGAVCLVFRPLFERAEQMLPTPPMSEA